MFENKKWPRNQRKSGRMEVFLDGEIIFFYEDSDFDVEIGPRCANFAENGPMFFFIFPENEKIIKNQICR